jgi:hypothetical protein
MAPRSARCEATCAGRCAKSEPRTRRRGPSAWNCRSGPPVMCSGRSGQAAIWGGGCAAAWTLPRSVCSGTAPSRWRQEGRGTLFGARSGRRGQDAHPKSASRDAGSRGVASNDRVCQAARGCVEGTRAERLRGEHKSCATAGRGARGLLLAGRDSGGCCGRHAACACVGFRRVSGFGVLPRGDGALVHCGCRIPHQSPGTPSIADKQRQRAGRQRLAFGNSTLLPRPCARGISTPITAPRAREEQRPRTAPPRARPRLPPHSPPRARLPDR